MLSRYRRRNRMSKNIKKRKYKYLKPIENTGKKAIVDKKTGLQSYVWKWRCVCGNIIEAPLSRISIQRNQSCGCKNLETKQKLCKKNSKKMIKPYKGTAIVRISSVMSDGFTQVNNSTGVNGVSIKIMDGKKYYYARIGIQGKSISLGYFRTLEKAKKARKLAETKYYVPIIREYQSTQSFKEIRKVIKKEVEKADG